jgi:hypothetical protein
MGTGSTASCSCTPTGATETNCGDGVDDDCDGLVDCLDPDCLHKACNGVGTVCCSTAANATACKNITNDAANCGVCGAVCASGTCSPKSGSGYSSGQCTCTTSCPKPGNVTSQTCSTGLCTCGDDNDRCGAASGNGSTCAVSFCHY